MQSFLEEFYDLVDDHLGDPHTSKRFPKARKLRDFRIAEAAVWEMLMKATGQESMVGRTETNITLQNDVEHYLLPGNFRQFIRFQLLDADSNPTKQMRSIGEYEPGPGAVIKSAQRGMVIRPIPVLSGDETWTLTYLKGPIRLHYATATNIGPQSIAFGRPEADGGDLISVDDYYKGALVSVYDADTGAPQTREMTSFHASDMTAQLRHPWSPKPTGTVKYEIRPALPPDYDALYALWVSARLAGNRAQFGRQQALRREFNDLLEACLRYFVSNVADRAPTRQVVFSGDHLMDPYSDG